VSLYSGNNFMPHPKEAQWTEKARKQFLGKTIVAVNYMTDENAKQMDWWERPLLLKLSDGTVIYASCDPECNGPGTLLVDSDDANNGGFPPL
jgi:hypothetical protein